MGLGSVREDVVEVVQSGGDKQGGREGEEQEK